MSLAMTLSCSRELGSTVYISRLVAFLHNNDLRAMGKNFQRSRGGLSHQGVEPPLFITEPEMDNDEQI
jgi:hypothetical protein